MKKIRLILLTALLALYACTKENSVGLLSVDEGTGAVSFRATFEGNSDPDTKLGINTSTGALTWAAGDAIAIELTNGNFKTFTYSSEDGGKFTCTLGEGETIRDGGAAYYPATIANNGTPGSVNMPTSYAASISDGIATVKPPMKATVSLGQESIGLKHLGGILSITASYVPADANKLILTVPKKTVTGTFAVTSATDDYISAGSTETNSTVTLTFSAGSFGTSATEFFIPVPVTTFSNGFTVDFKNASNETLYTHSTAKTTIEVDRKSIKRMANLTVPKYVYVYNNSGWSGTIYAYIWGANSSSVEVNNGWTGASFSGSTYTHNSHSYHRFALPDGIATDGNIIVHGDGEDADFKRTDNNGETAPSFSIDSDVYLTVAPFTPTNYTFYLIDETDGNNGVIRTWGSKNIDSPGHEGCYINALGTISKNSRIYHYFDFPSGSTLYFWFKEGNDWSLGYYSGDKQVGGDCNVVYYYKGNGGGDKWYYDYYYPAVKITKE